MNIASQKDQLLINLLSATTLRYRVLTNNLANQNTPGYTRKTVGFEDLLSRELEERQPDLLSIAPQVEEDLVSPATPDGNNVSMELELNGIMQNRLRYETYASILTGRMELLRTAIQGDR
jgi:flagellar basal-body rod protein FlgB